MSTPSLAQLKQAVAVAEQIEKLKAELTSLMGGGSSITSVLKVTTASAVTTGKRTMSAAGRARIAAAQKARWAKQKGEQVLTAVVKAEKKVAAKIKRTLSPAGRAKIVAALKARWAAKKKAAPAPVKSAPASKPAKKAKGKRTISPEGRAKMAEAAKKRWAKAKN